MALEAEVEIAGAEGRRRIPLVGGHVVGVGPDADRDALRTFQELDLAGGPITLFESGGVWRVVAARG